MLYVTPAVFIPSYSNFIYYDFSHIEHVCTYILCTFDNILGFLNLDIIASTPPFECLHVFCN